MSGLYNRILVPLDGSDTANQALPYAQQLATQCGAELILFRVVPDLKSEVTVKDNMPFVEHRLDHQENLIDQAATWLERSSDDLALHSIKAHPIVDVGEAADCIVAYAAENNVDVIVMSSHGRTGVARWIYGSVAAKVLAAANCSVLLVRSRLNGAATKMNKGESAA